MSKVGLLIGLGASVLSFIFLAASCGGNDWINQGGVTMGLWKMCGGSICNDLNPGKLLHFLLVAFVSSVLKETKSFSS